MQYKFQLYVADNKPSSARAKNQIRKILNKTQQQGYELEIIDIKQSPYLAEENKVFAIPTLIKVSPLPPQRAIGDLSNTERLMEWIDSCYLL